MNIDTINHDVSIFAANPNFETENANSQAQIIIDICEQGFKNI